MNAKLLRGLREISFVASQSSKNELFFELAGYLREGQAVADHIADKLAQSTV